MVRSATRWRVRWWKNLLIGWFIRHFNVDMSEASEPSPADYPDFNSFFTRSLKPGARPQPEQPGAITSPVDGRISQIGDIYGRTLDPGEREGTSPWSNCWVVTNAGRALSRRGGLRRSTFRREIITVFTCRVMPDWSRPPTFPAVYSASHRIPHGQFPDFLPGMSGWRHCSRHLPGRSRWCWSGPSS